MMEEVPSQTAGCDILHLCILQQKAGKNQPKITENGILVTKW